jgi:hypothetical protein
MKDAIISVAVAIVSLTIVMQCESAKIVDAMDRAGMRCGASK